MPSWVECDAGHRAGKCRLVAAYIAEHGSGPACRRQACGAAVQYIMTYHYPRKGTPSYRVVHVARLYDDPQAEHQAFDPMLFALRNLHTREMRLLPFYWTRNPSGRWHVGQFPPLLSVSNLAALIASLPDPVRVKVLQGRRRKSPLLKKLLNIGVHLLPEP